jgi:hypothetical protein
MRVYRINAVGGEGRLLVLGTADTAAKDLTSRRPSRIIHGRGSPTSTTMM